MNHNEWNGKYFNEVEKNLKKEKSIGHQKKMFPGEQK
jgi:hypothetical protein